MNSIREFSVLIEIKIQIKYKGKLLSVKEYINKENDDLLMNYINERKNVLIKAIDELRIWRNLNKQLNLASDTNNDEVQISYQNFSNKNGQLEQSLNDFRREKSKAKYWIRDKTFYLKEMKWG